MDRPALRMDSKVTHHVSWTNLASNLSFFLFGEKRHIDLLESANDTDYSIDAVLDEGDMDKVWVDQRAELIGKLRIDYIRELEANKHVTKSYMRTRYVGVEHYRLRTLMLAAVEQGWLEPGCYVVTESW